jgi:hypothetical protein
VLAPLDADRKELSELENMGAKMALIAVALVRWDRLAFVVFSTVGGRTSETETLSAR